MSREEALCEIIREARAISKALPRAIWYGFGSFFRGGAAFSDIGTIDRSIRILAGVALILLAALGKLGAWGYIGIVPFATGLFRFCPAYCLIVLTTCPAGPKKT
jgi:hypothetical protein